MGWGLIDVEGNRLQHVASGVIATDGAESVPLRLCELHGALQKLIRDYQPQKRLLKKPMSIETALRRSSWVMRVVSPF